MDHEQTRSTSKTDIKRDLNVFFKNDLKEPREIKLLGKATLHMVFHSFTIRTKYEAWKVQVLQAETVR